MNDTMGNALSALFASRKFWVGTITVLAIIAGVVLVSLGKIDTTQLAVTVTGIAGVGMSVIGSIAWEDAATKSSSATTQTTNVTTTKEGAS